MEYPGSHKVRDTSWLSIDTFLILYNKSFLYIYLIYSDIQKKME